MKAEDVKRAIENGEIEIYAFAKRIFIKDDAKKGVEVPNRYIELTYDPLYTPTPIERKRMYRSTLDSLGLCNYCGSPNVEDGKKLCVKCAEESARDKRRRREVRKNAKRKCM